MLTPLEKHLNYATRGAPSYLREDVRQAAIVGLLEAKSRFEPRRGASLQAFASWRMRGAVSDFYRRWFPMSRNYMARVKAGEFLAISVYPLVAAENLKAIGPSPERECLLSEIRGAVERLSPQEAQVLRGIYWNEHPRDEIAASLHCRVGHVDYVHRVALGKLLRHMAAKAS